MPLHLLQLKAFMSGCNAFDAANNRCAPSGSDKGVSYLPLRRWPPLPRSAHTVTLTLLSSFAPALRLQVKCNPLYSYLRRFLSRCRWLELHGIWRAGRPQARLVSHVYAGDLHKTGGPFTVCSPIPRVRGDESWCLAIASIYAAARGWWWCWRVTRVGFLVPRLHLPVCTWRAGHVEQGLSICRREYMRTGLLSTNCVQLW